MDISSSTVERPVSISASAPSESSVNSSVVKEDVVATDDASILTRYDDNDDDPSEDEEGDVCRICRNPGDFDNQLRYPCVCSGSIKYVHQECLLQWVNHSNATHCEVCKHPFAFSPVYADNAPTRLPFREFILGMGKKACYVLHIFMQLIFIFVIVPSIDLWIWRIAFVRSFGEVQRLFFGHISATVILTDWLHGFLLFLSVAIIYILASYYKDYIVRHPGQANRNLIGDVNVGNAGVAQGVAGAGGGNLIRRYAENVAVRWQMQQEARNDRNFLYSNDECDILACNLIFLGVFIFVPFSLGRIIVYYMSWVLSFAISHVLSTVPVTESALSLANLTSETQENGVLGHVAEMLSVNSTGSSGTSSDLTSGMSIEFLKGQSVGASTLSDVTTLVVGYLSIFSIVFFYLGLVSLIKEPLNMGRFHGLSSIAEAIPSLFRHFILAMRYLMTRVKITFLLLIELGVFPLMCGWWLNVCTMRMFGKSFAEKVDFFSVSPLASASVHWVIGIIYMLQIRIFVSLLIRVLRPGVLYFLCDPADPLFPVNNHGLRVLRPGVLYFLCDPAGPLFPVHNHGRRVLLSVAVYGSLIVMLVFFPVKLAMRVSPSIFPLDISISDPFTEIPADVLLFQICIPFSIRHFKLRTTVKSFLRYWFTAVGWSLGLIEFLLPRPEDSGDPARQYRVHGRLVEDRGFRGLAADNVNRASHVMANTDISENENDVQVEVECSFMIRIVMLLVVAWMTLLLFNCVLIVVPISLGRSLFDGIPFLPITHGIKCNDLYAFIIGSYVIWTIIAGVKYCFEHIKSRKVKALLKEISKWGGIVLKSSALLSLWIIIIPVLIGLLFELLVIVPMRVPVDESPVFLLYQDWALGLIFLKIWTRLVMLDRMMPLVNDSWRIKFERVREDGFSRLQGFWIMREIVLPIIIKLLTSLCVPYVLARGVFPVFGYPLVINSTFYRFAWLGCLGFSSLFYCAKRSHVWFTNLHNYIRDDRYLIGRRLRNFGEDGEQQRQRELLISEIESHDTDSASHVEYDQEVADLGLRHRHIVHQEA